VTGSRADGSSARTAGGDDPRRDADDGSARGRILARIREALASRDAVPHPGPAPGAAGAGREHPADRFARSLIHGGGEVVRLGSEEEAGLWLREFSLGFSSAVVSGRVPRALRPGLPPAEAHAAELGVSVALAGAGATGSLILSSGEGRALQLLPPTHLVWVEAEDIVTELEEALAHARSRELPATLALHSGPSKSADIGRILVTGVHGPGRLVAAVTAFPLAPEA
jgi:L-lactate dehydrogenase complex protein LldG